MKLKLTTPEVMEVLYKHYVDCVTCEELPFNHGRRRIDFFVLKPHKPYEALALEVKVSRADFKRDSLKKQHLALAASNRFFYVVPEGLIDKSEVPEWAGLMEVRERTHYGQTSRFLHVVKRAPKTDKPEPTWQMVIATLRNDCNIRRDETIARKDLQLQLNDYQRLSRSWQQNYFEAHDRARALETELNDLKKELENG